MKLLNNLVKTLSKIYGLPNAYVKIKIRSPRVYLYTITSIDIIRVIISMITSFTLNILYFVSGKKVTPSENHEDRTAQ